MAAPITVMIGGQAVPIAEGTLRVDDAIEERSTAKFVVPDVAGVFSFRRGQPVEIRDADGGLIFAGFVDQADLSRPDGAYSRHEIACVDNTYLADKRIASRSYVGMAAGDIVADLASTYLADEGVTWTTGEGGTVQPGPVIEEAVVNYRPVSEAIGKLAETADYIWWIDHERVLHFCPRDALPAPWELTAADVDEAQGPPVVSRGNPKYRNVQYVRGGTDITDPLTETRKGDGVTTAFAMSFPLAKVPSIEVNGAPQTVGIKGVDTGKDWYWSEGDAVIAQDQSATPLAATDTLSVTYQGQYPVVVVTRDDAAVIDRQQVEGGGTGLVEDVDDEPETTTRDAAFQKANALLQRYGVIGRTLRFRTRRAGLAPGQILTVTLPDLGLDGTEMLVTAVSTSDRADVLYRDVTAVEGPSMGSWVLLFGQMATRGLTFVPRVNVGEDRILVVLTTTSESWAWDEAATVTPFACPVPAADLYPAATLYPC